MADSTALSTDIYDLAKIVQAVEQKYTDMDEDTLALGIYGYFNEMHQNILQNATVMASNYSNEAIPTRAKFERNVICHAVSLGINKIRATPAEMKIALCIPEDRLIANMSDDMIVIDKEIPIYIGDSQQYEYHLDFDIAIKRNLLPNGNYVYTALYDMNNRNEDTDITSPYLDPIGIINIDNSRMIMLNTVIRNVTHSEVYKSIIVNNPLESKTVNFTFEHQLAYFFVEVVEGTKTHYLECVYDGLYSTDGGEYCNYMYIDEKNIRIKFNRDSYQPRANCNVTVHIYTTLGSTCNFAYSTSIVQDLVSSNYTYNALYCVIRPIGDSENGTDKLTVDEIKEIIPKQMLMRNSVTTYTDLNNFFNSIQTNTIRLYFLEKIHNQEERLYYSYLLLKDGGNIVPTNTLDITFNRDMFTSINGANYIIQPGAAIYNNGSKAIGVPALTNDNKLAYDKSGFLYMNPFLTVINKNPFFVSYYLNILNYSRTLNFTYVNNSSEIQFICTSMKLKREFYTDRDTYKINIQIEQNIISDFSLVTTDDNGNITSCNIKVIGVIYIDGIPYRYINSEIIDYDDKSFIYTFQLTFKTSDIIDKTGKIAIEHGAYVMGGTTELTGYMPANVDFKFFILGKFDAEYGRGEGIDTMVPGLDKYTLCNVYSVQYGIDLYYDYSNFVGSYITLRKNEDASYSYDIKKTPLVRYTYLNTETRMQNFVNVLEKRRLYIEAALILLEDSFGIDFKFFNTYGPAQLYTIDGGDTLNKTNLTLTFEIKYKLPGDAVIQPEITTFIKNYMEDITDIGDFHASNLITAVTNQFSSQIVYIQLIDFNGYGNDKQNITKIADIDEFVEAHTVPEFLNVNTLLNDSADISYNVIS